MSLSYPKFQQSPSDLCCPVCRSWPGVIFPITGQNRTAPVLRGNHARNPCTYKRSFSKCPACALGIVFKTAVSTYYLSRCLSYESEAAVSERAEDIFASSPLQPPPEFLHALLLPTETEEFSSHGTYLPHEL